ncbi:MAG: D-alanyl-D-alanine carboxypeptidase, partial [Lachnospiraceae bacterium]|nr:D-alanyl-D-alanine carboxypeptidase [Lachnospiraceae bacterium]
DIAKAGSELNPEKIEGNIAETVMENSSDMESGLNGMSDLYGNPDEEIASHESPLGEDAFGTEGIYGGGVSFPSGLPKRYDFKSGDIVFTSDSSTVYMDSGEFYSSYGLMVDVDTGKVIAQKSGFEKMFPASMTKVMTVLTARQFITDEMLDEKVTLSYNAISYDLKNGCSSAGFEEGEVVTVRDLFYGTILPSGGEAAYMLAEYTAGTHEDFVKLMNDNCEALGISETTHFANCVGVYDDNNYSTCNDIAIILAAAMKDEFLSEVLGTRRYTTSVSDFHFEGIPLSNWFLRRIEDKDTGGYVCGAKTGFVNESGCCGVSMMKTDSGKTFICVSGNAWSSWRCIYDHVAAYNIYAIGNTGYHKN